MKAEHTDRAFGELLDQATPEMAEGWEARARGAVTNTSHPVKRRSHVRTALLVFACVSALGALGIAAGVIPFFVEGKLYFRSAEAGPGWTTGVDFHRLSGDIETPEGFPTSDGDASPADDEIAWSDFQSPWPHQRGDIWKARSDWSQRVNLTATAGLAGMNCQPRWSPDGTMIAFQHSDPAAGEYPCRVGWHVWVMNSDGSDAHRVTAVGDPPTEHPIWSPDGSLLLCLMSDEPGSKRSYSVTMDIWGDDLRVLPNVGSEAAWSPDGTKIASSRRTEGELDGVPGFWRQMILTNADGSGPEVLVEQFVVEDELAANYPTEDQLSSDPDFDWLTDVLAWVGPREPTWSPEGNKIAFLAAMPFDPYGPYYRNQVEIWVYDLGTDEITQVTDDDIAQYSPRWQK